jgi:hypothetical protein
MTASTADRSYTNPRDTTPYPWNDEQVAAISRKAAEWQLLLQVSVMDLSQQHREGTLYFMVRKDDLASRAARRSR